MFRKSHSTRPGINDFYIMDIYEPLDAFRSNIKYPALILMSLSGIYEA
jgi:hypothetical protein